MSIPFVSPAADESSAFLTSPTESISYGAFSREVYEFSEGLERHVGVIYARNSPAAVIAYFGFLHAGVVPVFLDAELQGDQLTRIIAHYRPRFLFGDSDLRVPGYQVTKTLRGHSLSESSDIDHLEINPDLAMLQLTSGSTGSPKAVRLSFRNIRSVSDSIGRYMRVDSNRVFYAHLPFHYVYGLSIVHLAATHGASLFFPESSFVQRDFWDQGKQFGVTDFSGVPFHYEALDRLRLGSETYGFLKCATQAGGKLGGELVRKFFGLFMTAGVEFFVMYGQAEASPRMSYLGPVAEETRFDSVGKPIDIGSFEIAETGDGAGEVLYRGENVALGYAASSDDLSRGDDFGGIVSTGDVGYLDDRGDLYLRGRAKRMIKVVGESVYLDEVEALLKEKFGGVAVVGKEDELVVAVPSGISLSKEGVNKAIPWLRSRHLSLKQVQEIPIAASGKVDYPELDRILWN